LNVHSILSQSDVNISIPLPEEEQSGSPLLGCGVICWREGCT